MRVAHICGAFSPLSETFIYDQIIELEAQGEECHVITLQRDNTTSRPFPRVHTVSCPWNPQRVRDRLLVSFGALDRDRYLWPHVRPEIENRLREVRPDIIHAHFGPMGALVAPIADALRVPFVVSFHGFDAFLLPRSKSWGPLLREVFSRASAILVVSELMQRHLIQLGSNPIRTHLVHVGKRLHEFPFIRWNGRRIRKWVSVGRLTEKKGHLDCIEAFRKLSVLDPGASLTIIGEGPARKQIEQHLRATKTIPGRITLAGALPQNETRNLMKGSDAFILCSKTAPDGDSEGIPTVLMEAQALGLPCVSTSHSGIPEVIPDQSKWLLANEGDVDGIFDRMHRLIHCEADEVSQIVSVGRAIVEANFDLAQETEKLRGVYASIITATAGTFPAGHSDPFGSISISPSMPI